MVPRGSEFNDSLTSKFAWFLVLLQPDPQCKGKLLHTRNHPSEIPFENATDNPLAHATEVQIHVVPRAAAARPLVSNTFRLW